MKNIDKLLESIEFISNRHKQYFGKEIVFVKILEVHEGRDRWALFKLPNDGNMEMRIDLQSLGTNLQINYPEFFVSFESEGINCSGFSYNLPKGWKDMEFQEYETIYPIATGFWKCTDEEFKFRVKRFNEVVERMKQTIGDNKKQ